MSKYQNSSKSHLIQYLKNVAKTKGHRVTILTPQNLIFPTRVRIHVYFWPMRNYEKNLSGVVVFNERSEKKKELAKCKPRDLHSPSKPDVKGELIILFRSSLILEDAVCDKPWGSFPFRYKNNEKYVRRREIPRSGRYQILTSPSPPTSG